MSNIQTMRVRYGAAFAVAILLALTVASDASAAVLRGGQSYELEADTTIDGDLYTVSKFLNTYGTTTGDIMGGASGITLEGAVGGDVNLVGGTITLSGPVQGDVRLLGGRMFIQGVITEDLLLLAGNVTVEEDAVIMGDLMVFGDRLVLRGEVLGNVEAHVRAVEITGRVGKDTELYLRESLSLTGDAYLGGSLSYEAPGEAFISDTATVVGNSRYQPVEASGGNLGFSASQIMMNILVLFVAAVLMIVLFPAFTDRAVDRALAGGGVTIFKGLLLAIAWPLAGIMLLATVIGSVPGAILLFSYIVTLSLTAALTPVLAGVVLARWLKKDLEPRWAWASLGAISLSVIVFLPVIGWFVRLLLFFLVFGTLCRMIYEAVWMQRKETFVKLDTAEATIDYDAKKRDTDEEKSST